MLPTSHWFRRIAAQRQAINRQHLEWNKRLRVRLCKPIASFQNLIFVARWPTAHLLTKSWSQTIHQNLSVRVLCNHWQRQRQKALRKASINCHTAKQFTRRSTDTGCPWGTKPIKECIFQSQEVHLEQLIYCNRTGRSKSVENQLQRKIKVRRI